MFDVHGAAVLPAVVTLEMLGDRVLIEPIEEGDRTVSGLLVKPDTAKEAPQYGWVRAVGPGRLTDGGAVVPMAVREGDKVLYGKYSGTRVTVNDVEMLTCRASDVLAIVREG